MARIRSVHPGLWTDEAFVSLSPMARLLWVGLWCESDDGGAFAWKPTTIKMRVLPADHADVTALLAELEAANLIRRYEAGGTTYGLVRNFCKFQRPKKPSRQHPVPDWWGTYVGSKGGGSEPDPDNGAAVPPQGGTESASSGPSSPPVPHQFPTGTEIGPQMEDGGGRSKNRGERDSTRPREIDVPPPVQQSGFTDSGLPIVVDATTGRRYVPTTNPAWPDGIPLAPFRNGGMELKRQLALEAEARGGGLRVIDGGASETDFSRPPDALGRGSRGGGSPIVLHGPENRPSVEVRQIGTRGLP
jgi:hypothetical protein